MAYLGGNKILDPGPLARLGPLLLRLLGHLAAVFERPVEARGEHWTLVHAFDGGFAELDPVALPQVVTAAHLAARHHAEQRVDISVRGEIDVVGIK